MACSRGSTRGKTYGRQRRDNAEAKLAGEYAAVAGEVDKVAGRSKDVLGAPRHFEADLGQRDLAGPPLHQLSADFALKFAHLHRQSRLGHRAISRRAAEMAVVRKRG